MKRETSIRFRLTLWYASVLAAGLIVFAALIWISLRQALMHEVDQDLNSRAHGFELFLRNELAEVPVPPLKEELEEFCTALPSLSYLRLHSLDRSFAFSYPASSPGPGTGSSTSSSSSASDGRPNRWTRHARTPPTYRWHRQASLCPVCGSTLGVVRRGRAHARLRAWSCCADDRTAAIAQASGRSCARPGPA